MTYFPSIRNEESIKFSYFSRIQTEAIKQMMAGKGCYCGLCQMVSGRGAGVVDGVAVRCVSGVVWSLKNLS